MSCEKGVRKFSLDEIKKAGRRADRSSRGNDEEYYSHLISVYKEMEPLRRRAEKYGKRNR